jgi:tetratricopeptide (TPR) repeat protein
MAASTQLCYPNGCKPKLFAMRKIIPMLLSILSLLLLTEAAVTAAPNPSPRKTGTPTAADIAAAKAKVRRTQSNAQLNVAQSNYDQGKYKESIALYDRYIQSNPQDATAYGGRGNARFANGDKQGALTDFDRALQLDPKLWQILRNRAIAKVNLGDKKGAIADMRQAVQLQPQEPELNYLLGLGLYEQGDLPGAKQSLQKALGLYQRQGNKSKVQKITSILSKIS